MLFATSDLLNGSSSINSAEIDWDFPIESLGHGDTCHNNDAEQCEYNYHNHNNIIFAIITFVWLHYILSFI